MCFNVPESGTFYVVVESLSLERTFGIIESKHLKMKSLVCFVYFQQTWVGLNSSVEGPGMFFLAHVRNLRVPAAVICAS